MGFLGTPCAFACQKEKGFAGPAMMGVLVSHVTWQISKRKLPGTEEICACAPWGARD